MIPFVKRVGQKVGRELRVYNPTNELIHCYGDPLFRDHLFSDSLFIDPLFIDLLFVDPSFGGTNVNIWRFVNKSEKLLCE